MEGEQTHSITTAQAVGWPFQCGFRAVSKQFRSGFAIAFYRKTARVTPRLFCAVFRVHYRQNASSFFISFITKCSYGALSEQYSNSFTGRFPPPYFRTVKFKSLRLETGNSSADSEMAESVPIEGNRRGEFVLVRKLDARGHGQYRLNVNGTAPRDYTPKSGG